MLTLLALLLSIIMPITITNKNVFDFFASLSIPPIIVLVVNSTHTSVIVCLIFYLSFTSKHFDNQILGLGYVKHITIKQYMIIWMYCMKTLARRHVFYSIVLYWMFSPDEQ